ncbi:MAG: caspase family protein [Bradyrhizobiaceae bacterium]|nr:caspase family protein [Bradyrhizobiaceae bacterium]
MRLRLFSIAAALVGLVLVAVSATAAMAERRVALVIGNAAYQNASSLTNTVNDAAAMTRMFEKAGFDVVESRTDLGVVEFKRALREFMFTAQDADIAVVYFAGHGIEIRGSNYLIPVDAKLRSDYDADDEAISLERLILAVEPVKQLRLIILDACRDNPFLRRMQRAFAARAVTGGLATVEPSAGNTLIAYAAKAGSVSYDGAGPNSPFTTSLMKHLFEPGLDIRIAFGRVRDEVMKTTTNRQEPFVYGSLGGTTIALVKAPDQPAPALARVGSGDSRYDIQRDYEFAERIGTQQAWESFLQAHSTGYYAGLARAQLAKLKETAEKAVPSVIAAREPQNRDDSESVSRAPPPKDQLKSEPKVQPPRDQAKSEPKPQRKDRQARLEPKPEEDDLKVAPAASAIAVDPCKQEEEKLARLRANPVRDEIIRLERELTCKRLKLQVVRLRESVVGELPAATGATAVAPAIPIEDTANSLPQSGVSAAVPQPKQDGGNAAARRPDDCQKDQETLVRLRAVPTRADVARFERELSCERLRPQVLRLRESLGVD